MIEQRIKQLHAAIKNSDGDDFTDLLTEYSQLKEQHAKINQQRGRIITK
ncbi:MAG: hypothetical protein U5L09_12320 [Bacteroidales bacterium]|nr:hypothetical protein [Bacteroidales bacterium]